jgi:hypothetical protein
MALTDSKKMKIVTLLGYPAKTLIVSSTSYNSLVADRLNNLTPEAELLIKSNITQIEGIETRLTSSLGKAGLARIGDIEFFEGGQAFTDLKTERKRLLRELSDMVDIQSMRSGGVNVGVIV